MGRYGLLQEISSHTASRQSQGLHRVRLCLACLRYAHASVVLTNRRRQWRWKAQSSSSLEEPLVGANQHEHEPAAKTYTK